MIQAQSINIYKEETLNKKEKHLTELLQLSHVRDQLQELLVAFARKEGAQVALEFTQRGSDGLDALEAALLIGGAFHRPAFIALESLADTGDTRALTILRSAMDKRALYPGSFDPVNSGHLNIMFRAGKIFDEVIVGIGENPSKRPYFSTGEKIDLIEAEVAEIPGSFQVRAYSGLTSRFAEELNVNTLIRGVRGITDANEEQQLAGVLKEQSTGHQLETIFIPTELDLTFTSSTNARVISALRGGDASYYVPPRVHRALADKAYNQYLCKKWSEVFGDSTEAKSAFLTVCTRLSAPGRNYHTLEHLFEMFSVRDELITEDPKIASIEPDIIGAAIFYHDSIYDPKASSGANEDQSAEQARLTLRLLDWSAEKIERVVDLILMTKDHQLKDINDLGAALFLDLDLSIFGAGTKRYQQYWQQIRDEYSFVDEVTFNNRRPGIMEKFLARDPIYRTPLMKQRFEAKARENLKSEIEELRAHTNIV